MTANCQLAIYDTEFSSVEPMARTNKRTLGQVIRERRRQLNLTQQGVARRIKTSTPYVGHLEADKRRPSILVVSRLAEVLGLDQRDLFMLANPKAADLITPSGSERGKSAWNEFRTAVQIHRAHQITAAEMKLLSRVAAMGEVRSLRDFIFIIIAVRYAFAR